MAVKTQFIPKMATLMAAMDDFVETTSYDEPAASTADPEPDVEEGWDDEKVKKADVVVETPTLRSTIIQL